MKIKVLLSICLLFSGLLFHNFLTMAGDAAQYLDILETGNEFYAEGRYEEALDSYKRIFEAGYESAPFLMNMGNAYFKMNDIPSAILFYERGLRHSPKDEDIIFNLGVARSRIIDKIEEVPKLFFLRWWDQIRRSLPLQTWTYLSILAFIISLGFLAAYLMARHSWSKHLFFWPALVFFVFTLHAMIFSAQLISERKNQPEAIIFSPTVTIKSSPDHNSVDLFVLHEGTKIQMTDSIGEWIEIRIASGSKGWMPLQDVEKI